jgi:molybdopterin-guanine dinucleotide biosynthesis protein A
VDFDAIVLAGGGARRLGGIDKAELVVGGSRLIERVVGALVEARRVIAVGPRREGLGRVEWTSERPAGAGPAAALGAGLARADSARVVVAASDLPFLDRHAVRRLLMAVGEHDGAVGVDRAGMVQPLAGAYRRDNLSRALERLDDARGVSMAAVIEGLSLARVQGSLAWQDCDTWEEVVLARRTLGGDSVLEDWIDDVSRSFQITDDVDSKALLDASRVVAHKVERRAAPVTTYLMGLAVARGRQLEEVADEVVRLARGWDREEAPPS